MLARISGGRGFEPGSSLIPVGGKVTERADFGIAVISPEVVVAATIPATKIISFFQKNESCDKWTLGYQQHKQ